MGLLAERMARNTAAVIDTNDDYFRALWADISSTPELIVTESSDFNGAAVENELEALRAYADFMVRVNEIDDISGTKLDAVAFRFLALERLFQETDTNLRTRIKSLSQRRFNGNWAGLEMLKDVLSYYASSDAIYAARFAVETNLAVNGIFDEDLSGWTVAAAGSSGVEWSTTHRFEGAAAARLFTDGSGSGTSIGQTITGLAAGTHRVNFFLLSERSDAPAVNVQINRGSDGYYWNGGAWQSGAASIGVSSPINEWAWRSVPFILTGTDDVTVSFVTVGHVNHDAFIDMIEIGAVCLYPFVDLFVVSSGQSGSFMSLSGGTDDPITDHNYDTKGYFDNSYIGGSGTAATPVFIQDMLDIVRPAGVRVRYRQVDRNV
jgi:hypothetical protein